MNQPDFCDAEGAKRLGAKIRAYWAARGRVVRIVYEDQGFIPKMRSARVDVRSNMVDGWPPKATSILSRVPMKVISAALTGPLDTSVDLVVKLP